MGKIGIAIVAAALLVGGIAFAATNLGGNSGPSSPAAAVELLLTSVTDEDVLGALESIDPGERDAVLGNVEAIFGELQRLDVVSGSADLSGIDGIDIAFTDVELEPEEIRPGLARVYVAGGTITVGLDPSELPAGDLVHDLLDRFGAEPLADLPGETDTYEISSTGSSEDFFLVARDTGRDGWRVSLGYTMAEWGRVELGEPALRGGITAIGEESPEAAVAGFIGLVESLDPAEAIARLAPSEFRALHEYADVLLGPLPPAPDLGPVTITVDDLDLSARTSGNTADVTIEGFELTVTWDGDADFVSGTATASWTGDELSVAVDWEDLGRDLPAGSAVVTLTADCLTVDSDSILVEMILEDLRAPDGQICDDDFLDLFSEIDSQFTVNDVPVDDVDGFPDFGALDWLADITNPDYAIRTVRVDGEWYVAPIDTFGSLVANALTVIDRDHIEGTVDLIVDVIESFGTMFDPFDPVQPPPPIDTTPPTPGGSDLPPDWHELIEPNPSLSLTDDDLVALGAVSAYYFDDESEMVCAYETLVSGDVDVDEVLRSFYEDSDPSAAVDAIMREVASGC